MNNIRGSSLKPRTAMLRLMLKMHSASGADGSATSNS